MRTCIFILTALAALCSPLAAQNIKTLDLRTEPSHPQSPHARQARRSYYVILAARGGSATGHAFVLWGIEDGVRRRTTIQAFGLHRAVGNSLHLNMPRRSVTRWTPRAYVRAVLAAGVNKPPAVFP